MKKEKNFKSLGKMKKEKKGENKRAWEFCAGELFALCKGQKACSPPSVDGSGEVGWCVEPRHPLAVAKEAWKACPTAARREPPLAVDEDAVLHA